MLVLDIIHYQCISRYQHTWCPLVKWSEMIYSIMPPPLPILVLVLPIAALIPFYIAIWQSWYSICLPISANWLWIWFLCFLLFTQLMRSFTALDGCALLLFLVNESIDLILIIQTFHPFIHSVLCSFSCRSIYLYYMAYYYSYS